MEKLPDYMVHNDKEIKGFFGPYRFLSNFYPCAIRCFGHEFSSLEAAYQAIKCNNPADMIKFVGLRPGKAKKLGKEIDLRPDWELVKVTGMLGLLTQKFNRGHLNQMLKDTGERYLEETNNWEDEFWGVDINLGGANHLGRLLMAVRGMIVLYNSTGGASIEKFLYRRVCNEQDKEEASN